MFKLLTSVSGVESPPNANTAWEGSMLIALVFAFSVESESWFLRTETRDVAASTPRTTSRPSLSQQQTDWPHFWRQSDVIAVVSLLLRVSTCCCYHRASSQRMNTFLLLPLSEIIVYVVYMSVVLFLFPHSFIWWQTFLLYSVSSPSSFV